MQKDSRGIAGKGSGGVLAEIDTRLAQLDEQLAAHEELLAERKRLQQARATLLGESPLGQISKEHVAAYLAEHPGARPREIAKALGVPAGRVSAHLFRGKNSRFVSRMDGWYVREQRSQARRTTARK